MELTPGTRLHAYEITAPIGAGGMGHVYRARDTRLGRDVAIKVLPSSMAIDADRLARFEREAQILASLNHPNIATLYGVEDATGVPALVMELVDGPTLADRIAAGPIPIRDALPLARQIADALEAAHEQGIIHRDLKPANIKVRPDGAVKVLDFGLAKALDPAASHGGSATSSPTGREYLHVAIDDAKRLTYAEVLPADDAGTCAAFPHRGASAPAAPVAVDAMAHAHDPAEPLEIQMEAVADVQPVIPLHRRGWRCGRLGPAVTADPLNEELPLIHGCLCITR